MRNSCYANAVFQCAKKHFPKGYTQLKDRFPLKNPGVSKDELQAPKSLRSDTRSATARFDKLKADRELRKGGEDDSLGAWIGVFFDRLGDSGGGMGKAISSADLHTILDLRKEDFNGKTQQDAGEFASWLLDQLHTEWKRGKGPATPECPIKQSFQGSRFMDVRLQKRGQEFKSLT